MTFITRTDKTDKEEVQEITDLLMYNGKRVEYGSYCDCACATLDYRPPGYKYQLSNLIGLFEEFKDEDVYIGIGVNPNYLEEDLIEILSIYSSNYMNENKKLLNMVPNIKEIKDGIIYYDYEEFHINRQKQKEKVEELKKIYLEKRDEIERIAIERQIQYFKDQGIAATYYYEPRIGGHDILLIVKSYKQLEDFIPHPAYSYDFYQIGNDRVKEFIEENRS